MQTCAVGGCKRRVRAMGYCYMHYQRWFKNGDAGPADSWRETLARCSIDGCTQNALSKGWCSVHYGRWRTHGDPTKTIVTRRPESLSREDFFWSRVDKGEDNQCWEWLAHRDYKGYGRGT